MTMTRAEANKVFDETTAELVEIQRALNKTYAAWQNEVDRFNRMKARRHEAWNALMDGVIAGDPKR